MVTVTSTAPVPAGLTASIEVVAHDVKLVAGIVPKSTAVAPVNACSRDGDHSAAGGRTESRGQARHRRRVAKRSAGEVGDVPPGLVTVTSTVPVPAGLTAVIEVLARRR